MVGETLWLLPPFAAIENYALPQRFGYPQVPEDDEILYLLLLLSCLLASTMLTAHDPSPSSLFITCLPYLPPLSFHTKVISCVQGCGIILSPCSLCL